MSSARISPKRIAAEVARRILQAEAQTVPSLRRVRREVSKQLATASGPIVLDVATRLVDHEKVPSWVSYEIAHHHDGAMNQLNLAEIKRLGANLSSWGEVDAFACYLTGPAWREYNISNVAVQRWAKSKDRWWRRVAVVSTVPLNNAARGGSGDTDRTISICELVVCDRDDMVIKGLSWALRELAKKNATAVRKFIDSHESVLAARVKREVRNKLDTGLKNPGEQNEVSISVAVLEWSLP